MCQANTKKDHKHEPKEKYYTKNHGFGQSLSYVLSNLYLKQFNPSLHITGKVIEKAIKPKKFKNGFL